MLAGKRAIVTGSSSGIGRSIAIALAAQGASVVVNARGSEDRGRLACDEVVNTISTAGGTAIGVRGAVDDPSFCEHLVSECVSTFGGVDVLVNNAGIVNFDKVEDCPIDEWRRVIEVNLGGAFYMSRCAIPHMKRQRWGRILNASSMAGLGVLGGSAYGASKSGLIGLTRAMAGDCGPYGITVNAYNPEAVTAMGADNDPANLTPIFERWIDRGLRSREDMSFMAGVGGPEGVAPFIAYLCTEAADYLNGRLFAVDGRRVGLLSVMAEERILYHDPADGPWPLSNLERLAPVVFPVRNAWPKRSEGELEEWRIQDEGLQQ